MQTVPTGIAHGELPHSHCISIETHLAILVACSWVNKTFFKRLGHGWRQFILACLKAEKTFKKLQCHGDENTTRERADGLGDTKTKKQKKYRIQSFRTRLRTRRLGDRNIASSASHAAVSWCRLFHHAGFPIDLTRRNKRCAVFFFLRRLLQKGQHATRPWEATASLASLGTVAKVDRESGSLGSRNRNPLASNWPHSEQTFFNFYTADADS